MASSTPQPSSGFAVSSLQFRSTASRCLLIHHIELDIGGLGSLRHPLPGPTNVRARPESLSRQFNPAVHRVPTLPLVMSNDPMALIISSVGMAEVWNKAGASD